VLIWVAAMHCEAKPIIDYYRLKKSQVEHGFDLYHSDHMLCIISGIGKTAVAAACAWVAALYREQTSLAWFNIGIAGAADAPIGTAFWINKITDYESKRSYYPVPLIETSLKPVHCMTLNQASSEYLPQLLFDMEASAFFVTATRFSSAELVQCVKIVSDNLTQQTGLDKSRISQLIAQNIESLTEISESLQALDKQISANKIDASDWQKFIQRAHFSQTQKSQLKKSIQFLMSQDYDTEKLTREISGCLSSKAIIAHLKQLCLRASQNL